MDLEPRQPPTTAPRPPAHHVDPRAKRYWLVSGAAQLAAVVLAAGLPAVWWDAGRPWLLAVGGALALVTLPRAAVAPWLRLRVHRWEATDTAVYSRTGWLTREWRIAPLNRVQTVEVRRNALHRAFGLAAVTVTTGSAQGAVVIQGLDATVAEQLTETLTDAVARTQGDAT